MLGGSRWGGEGEPRYSRQSPSKHELTTAIGSDTLKVTHKKDAERNPRTLSDWLQKGVLFNRETTVSWTNGAGTTGHPQAKNRVGSLSLCSQTPNTPTIPT